MLRTKQYVKLYRKYHSWDLNQLLGTWTVAQRAYNKLLDLYCISEWRRLKHAKESVSNMQ